MKKRILSIALSIVMLIGLLPITAGAVETHTHCVCGRTEACVGHNANTSWNAWNDGTSLPTNAGNYYLNTDVKLSDNWNITNNVKLCLNGHKIDLNEHVIGIGVGVSGKDVTITDCNSTNTTYTFSTTGTTANGNGGLWVLDPEATGANARNVIGGIITGGKGFAPNNGDTRLGGAVYIINNGSFTLQGGTLVGNQARDAGGAVYMNGGTFNMYGGSIKGNVCDGDVDKVYGGGGGGVYMAASDTFNMTQGTISENISCGEGNGGGVAANSTFNISGNPVITGNTVNGNANNVYLPSGKSMTVTGDLTTGANIGVSIGTTLDANTVSATVASFNDGVTVAGTKNYFTKDDNALQAEIFESGGTVKIGLPSYDVTFDTNGGSVVDPQTILSGKKASEPFFNPTKADHSFVGWYADEELTEEFNFNTAITEATTIYARWKENTYSIDLKLNGESVNSIVFPGASVLDTEDSITFKLHNTGDAEIPNVNALLSGANAEEFTLEFAKQNVGTGASANLILSAKENLAAGTYAATLTIKGDKGNTLVIPVSLTVTAKEYSIELDPDYGSETSDAVSVTQKAVTNNTVAPGSRTGYTFDGWFTAEGDKVYDAAGKYVVGSYWDAEGKWIYNGDGDSLKLYAHWTANKYTVTFDAKDGTVDPASQQVTYAAPYSALPTPAKTGYTFGGWFTLANGEGVQIEAGDTVEITSDIELIAKWTAIPAAAPTVGGSNLTLTYGYTEGSINVTATPADGHTITAHQWYSNDIESNENGTPIPDAVENSYAIPTSKNAGTYYYYCVVTTKRTDNNETMTKASDVITVTIDKKTLAVPTVTGSYTYTGEELTASISGFDDNTMQMFGQPSGTNADEYTVSFTLKDTTNYKWENSENANVSVTWNIAKADAAVTAPTPRDLVYNGEPNSLIDGGTAEGGTMQYSLDNINWSAEIPEGTDAKTYTVYYKVVGDANHNDASDDSYRVVVTIAKKEISITGAAVSDKPYDGNANATVTGVTFDEATLVKGTDYTVTGAFPDANADAEKVNVTVTVTLIGNAANNYKLAAAEYTANAAAKITKIDGSVTAPTAKTPAYTGEAQELINAGSSATGAIQYKLNGGEYGTAIPTANDAGTYTVWYRVVGDANHNDVAEASVAVTIAKADLNAAVSIEGWTYKETANAPSVTGNDGNGDVVYAYKVKDAADGTYTAEKPTNAGTYTVKATIAETANYNGKTVTADFTIAKAKVAIPAADETVYTYNGAAQNYTLAASEDYTFGGDSVTQTNAGTYTITATLDDTANTEWSDGTTAAKNYTFTIAKAAVTVTAKDQNIYVGQDAPDLSAPVEGTHYTVTGLFGEDTIDLSGIVMGYRETPDTSAAGTFGITISGAVGGTNYEVAYTAGALTVSTRPVDPSPSAPSTYKVEDKTPENSDGSINLSKGNAKNGEKVTITVTPDEYYKTEKVIVKDKNGIEIEVTANEDGTFSFKMPASKVTVEPVFSWDNPFTDVSEDAYYTPAVEWALKNDITNGTGDGTTFSPADSCTRAQMATFLWRAAGSPDPAGSSNPFADVSEDAYYAKAVQWAYEQGITDGTSDTTFSPDAACTRAQMVTFLHRVADTQKPEGNTNPFTDVPDAYYTEAVQWAYEQSITSGTSATTFSPDAICARGQMVTFLYRFFVK